jgi:2-oxoglutarate dehydrogenase E2 component (dihydrolipoamide succinyltransferase)
VGGVSPLSTGPSHFKFTEHIMATKVEVPEMGESISEAVILRWMKTDGDTVAEDEALCELETDKATFDLP